MEPIRWLYKGQAYVSEITRVCPTCGEFAVVELPEAVKREQPDDTTHVCHPLAGGCNQGYALDD